MCLLILECLIRIHGCQEYEHESPGLRYLQIEGDPESVRLLIPESVPRVRHHNQTYHHRQQLDRMTILRLSPQHDLKAHPSNLIIPLDYHQAKRV